MSRRGLLRLVVASLLFGAQRGKTKMRRAILWNPETRQQIEPTGGPQAGAYIIELPYTAGECSWFGGPEDTGVNEHEGLAFEDGLARELNPVEFYVAIRPYDKGLPRRRLEFLNRLWSGLRLEVRFGARSAVARLADWGPRAECGMIDCSPGLLAYLGAEHDSILDFGFPASQEIPCGPLIDGIRVG